MILSVGGSVGYRLFFVCELGIAVVSGIGQPDATSAHAPGGMQFRINDLAMRLDCSMQ
jgi:hypothetical protein